MNQISLNIIKGIGLAITIGIIVSMVFVIGVMGAFMSAYWDSAEICEDERGYTYACHKPITMSHFDIGFGVALSLLVSFGIIRLLFPRETDTTVNQEEREG